jgi:hypothetical protein
VRIEKESKQKGAVKMILIQLLIFSFFLNKPQVCDLRAAFKQSYVNSRGRRSCLCRSSFRAKPAYRTQKSSLIDLLCALFRYSNSYFLNAISRLRSSITKALTHFDQLAGSIVPSDLLFIDNKPNFPDTPMNANKELTKVYEKYTVFRCPRNKPKQTQANPTKPNLLFEVIRSRRGKPAVEITVSLIYSSGYRVIKIREKDL